MQAQNFMSLATSAMLSLVGGRPAPAPSIARRVSNNRPPAAPPRAALGDFAWDGPIAAKSASAPDTGLEVNRTLILQRKIRDRYIAARFPCTAQSSTDLENSERMIKAARLFFEEEQSDRAMELLSLAIEQCPTVESLRLAQLEIAFLTRDADTYRQLALEFRKIHPASKDWEQVARLGRSLSPQEDAFGRVTAGMSHAHYGPWPDTPNWIHASWDLTGEVLGNDFHKAMNT